MEDTTAENTVNSSKIASKGNTTLLIIAIIVFLVVLVASAYLILGMTDNGNEESNNLETQDDSEIEIGEDSILDADEKDAPSIYMKSIGFNLDYYDPATNMAGDMEFTRIPLQFNKIWSDFGEQDPRTTDTTKKNPQPTFILPVGTKVQSLVEGEVVEVKELYSNDFTIMVASKKDSTWIFETEHVDNPLVEIGDRVTAGQIIAEVSSYDTHNHEGFGTLEIGLLHPVGTRPSHICLFQYLDPAIKDDISAKISALYTSWEEYLGMPELYDQENFAMPGCVTTDPFIE